MLARLVALLKSVSIPAPSLTTAAAAARTSW